MIEIVTVTIATEIEIIIDAIEVILDLRPMTTDVEIIGIVIETVRVDIDRVHDHRVTRGMTRRALDQASSREPK